MQESTSHLDNHVELERKSSEEKVSSMFVQNYSAILSSLKNSRKNRKFKQTLGLKVPSGPNRLHNWSHILMALDAMHLNKLRVSGHEVKFIYLNFFSVQVLEWFNLIDNI